MVISVTVEKRARALSLALLAGTLACVGSEVSQTVDSQACGVLWDWEIGHELTGGLDDPEGALEVIHLDMTKARLNVLSRAAEVFCRLEGRYPLSLAELLEAHETGEVAACRIQFLDDAWGRPIRYDMVEGQPRLISDSPDGIADTPDDVAGAMRDAVGAVPSAGCSHP